MNPALQEIQERAVFRFPNFKKQLVDKGSAVTGIPMGHPPSLDHFKHFALAIGRWNLGRLTEGATAAYNFAVQIDDNRVSALRIDVRTKIR